MKLVMKAAHQAVELAINKVKLILIPDVLQPLGLRRFAAFHRQQVTTVQMVALVQRVEKEKQKEGTKAENQEHQQMEAIMRLLWILMVREMEVTRNRNLKGYIRLAYNVELRNRNAQVDILVRIVIVKVLFAPIKRARNGTCNHFLYLDVSSLRSHPLDVLFSAHRGPPKGSKRQRKMTGDSSTPAPVAREKSSKKDRVIVIDTKKQIEESRTEDIDAKPSPHMSTASLRASSHGTSAQTPNSQNKSLPAPLSASSTAASNSLFPHHPHQQQTISPSPVNAFSQLASMEQNIHSSHQPISPHVTTRMSVQHPNPLPSYEFGYPHIEHPVELPSVENRIPDQTLYGMQSLGLLYNVPDNSVQHVSSTASHNPSSSILPTFSQPHHQHQQAPAVTVTAAAPLRPLNDSSLYREAPEHVTVIEGGDTPDGRMLLIENDPSAEGSSKSGESDSHRHHQDVTEAYRGASSGIPSLHAHRHHSDDAPMNGGKRTRSLSGAARPRHADLYANIRDPKGSHLLRYGDSLRTHSGDDDVFEDEDRDLFTLPPIRLSSSRSQGNGISSPNFPLLIPQGLFDRLIA
jgi:hypothetical protein